MGDTARRGGAHGSTERIGIKDRIARIDFGALLQELAASDRLGRRARWWAAFASFVSRVARALARRRAREGVESSRRPDLERRFDGARDIVEEGSWESFPASDPPSTMSPR